MHRWGNLISLNFTQVFLSKNKESKSLKIWFIIFFFLLRFFVFIIHFDNFKIKKCSWCIVSMFYVAWIAEWLFKNLLIYLCPPPPPPPLPLRSCVRSRLSWRTCLEPSAAAWKVRVECGGCQPGGDISSSLQLVIVMGKRNWTIEYTAYFDYISQRLTSSLWVLVQIFFFFFFSGGGGGGGAGEGHLEKHTMTALTHFKDTTLALVDHPALISLTTWYIWVGLKNLLQAIFYLVSFIDLCHAKLVNFQCR